MCCVRSSIISRIGAVLVVGSGFVFSLFWLPGRHCEYNCFIAALDAASLYTVMRWKWWVDSRVDTDS